MNFSSQTRLKLRVAIISNKNIASVQNSVPGVKREAISSGSLVLKQFLLLIPVDSTFSDLKSLTLLQYEKLYKTQIGFAPLKKILLFQDCNHCDLDEDYLVTEICDSNDFVFAVSEVEDQSNKKVKITNPPPVNQNKNNSQQQNQKQQQQQQQQQQQSISSPKSQKQQNEKKVPEFKPTAIKVPTNPKTSEVSKVVDEKVTHTPTESTAVKVNVPVNIDSPRIIESIETEKKIEPLKPTKVNVPVKIQKPETKREQQQQKQIQQLNEITSHQIQPEKQEVEPEKVIDNVSIEPANVAKDTIITPVPTPNPVTVSGSTPIFLPRKSSTSPDSSSEDEAETELSTFQTSNLFGPQVITTEPRRSDAFVLFAADSSSENEDSSDEDMNTRNHASIPKPISPPAKPSSIISLQAGPSSEIEDCSSSSDNESLPLMSNAQQSGKENVLPQSVTLRRLSSVSPIPEPSEIPSLDELKESLCRAPTPIQIIAEKQSQSSNNHPKQNQQPKQQKSPHHNNHNHHFNNMKRGRPAKKQAAGRPKKE